MTSFTSECGLVTDVPTTAAHNTTMKHHEPARGKPAPKEPKKKKKSTRQTDIWRFLCKKKSPNFKTALKILESRQSSKTVSDELWLPVLLWKPFPSMTCPTAVIRPPQESCNGVEAPYCIHICVRSGYRSGLVSYVISMRYCTGCGEARWNSLRHCVRLIDLNVVYFSIACLCSLGQKRSTSSDDWAEK